MAITKLNRVRNFLQSSRSPMATFVFYKTIPKGNDITSIEDPSNSSKIEIPKNQVMKLLYTKNILPQKQTHLVVESLRVLEPNKDMPADLMNRIFRASCIKPNGVIIVDEFSELRGFIRTSGIVSIHKSRFGWGTFGLEETFIKGSILEGNSNHRMLPSNNGLKFGQFLSAMNPWTQESIKIIYGKIVNSYISSGVTGNTLEVENSYIGSHPKILLEDISIKNSVIPEGRIVKSNLEITGIMDQEKALYEALNSASDHKKASSLVRSFIKDNKPIKIGGFTFEGEGKFTGMATAIALLIESKRPELVKEIFSSLKTYEAEGVINLLDKLNKVSRYVGPLAEKVTELLMRKTFWFYNSREEIKNRGISIASGKTMQDLESEVHDRLFPKRESIKTVPV
ncbi:MAG: hypothetical protein NT030_01000 [Candidatus Saganbacteria bacterium]|nr:hypothetical protein [Candidatus Saganbacteria bacterium]